MDLYKKLSVQKYSMFDLGCKCVQFKPKTKRQLKKIVGKTARRKLKKELKEINTDV